MHITKRDLERWKNNSIQLAMKLNYDPQVLDFIDKNTQLTLIKSLPPKGNWYGWCRYDDQEIQVYHRNLSTEPREILIAAMTSKNIPAEAITQILKIYASMEREAFFEIYNQSGMDHEVIGHLYNYLTKQDHSEKAASLTQIEFAKVRGKTSPAWTSILTIMPIVLAYHKGIDELKS